jgi:hypothetical protein
VADVLATATPTDGVPFTIAWRQAVPYNLH